MLILKYIIKIFKILASETSPNQIAIGFALGMVLGLTPFLTVHNFIIIILLLLFQVNIATALFGMAIFSGIAYLLDPAFHNFGYYLLVELESMNEFWITLYNMPIVALSKYNNTIVMGSFVIALIALIPMFFFIKYFVIIYRSTLHEKFEKMKLYKVIKSSKLVIYYNKFKG
ncbi:MAG: TIGR03546 family protein [Candidatus Marinimicrobia bacterium]|nr:TIGR03546 family protein [Candidatus Neomarinimicrobiota bacterium]